MKFRECPAFPIAAAFAICIGSVATAQTTPPPPATPAAPNYPCRTMPEAHQLDFWIGEWDVNPWQQPSAPPASVGVNSVHAILEHCVILEEWSGKRGGKGKSFNFYDTNTLKWRQIWMADGGGPLDYSGELKDNAMHFQGWTLGTDSKRVLQKLTFTRVSQDTVRQTFEASTDEGKTWKVTFDGRYVRRKVTGASDAQ